MRQIPYGVQVRQSKGQGEHLLVMLSFVVLTGQSLTQILLVLRKDPFLQVMQVTELIQKSQ